MIKTHKLSTKASTLLFLKDNLKKSKIEEMFSFSFSSWKKDEQKLMDNIHKKFKGVKIIIRSSAINEDGKDNSMAGYFESILNVNSSHKEEIKEAIIKVFDSYKKKKSLSAFNRILVQKQTENVVTSGVLFTRTLTNYSPYYVINYDSCTGSTESVTSGLDSKTIKIFKFAKKKDIPTQFKKLITAVKEIEKLFPQKGLDIEFAITSKQEVVIFQVRPLTQVKNVCEKILCKKIKELKKKFKIIRRENKIYADMPDWNPAEIIGDNPGHLDWSLYDHIITKKIWHMARTSQGYCAGEPSRLVILFGNKPYVDVHASFSSFIPKEISQLLKKKLISFYMKKLKKHPELQDKVEFEVVYTCYDFCFDERSKELLLYGFSSEEIDKIKKPLIDITNNLITNAKSSIKEDLASLVELKKNRESLKISEENNRFESLLKCSKFLLEDCQIRGTLQFSRLARLGFLGKILLNSLINKNIISESQYNLFMESIKTVATEFDEDFSLMATGKILRENFIKKYYHLRSGTYDITSKRYESNISLLNPPRIKKEHKKNFKKFVLNKKLEKEINRELSQNEMNFDTKELFNFIKRALEAREFSKFEFTKNLSDAMELIALAGNEIGFSRNELAFLNIEELFEGIIYGKEIEKKWRKIIFRRMEERKINCQLELPSIIFSKKDFTIIKEYTSRPNYITQKKIIARLATINKKFPEQSDVKNKIILLENGDPGYDWVFTRNPAGLITKYGGIASHMSIRCAEFGIPAAIGCGSLFDKLLNKKQIVLDCQLKKITSLEVHK